jgi:hypothetical protein
LAGGKARMKREIAQRVELDVAGMPYHDELVAWIEAERKRGLPPAQAIRRWRGAGRR